MIKQKSPFKGFTVEEVLKIERNSFVIQLGNDFYNKDGNFTFSESQVNKYYNSILNKILYAISNGTDKQKRDAIKCLSTFRVFSLRIQ
jgi:hypothetical protein